MKLKRMTKEHSGQKGRPMGAKDPLNPWLAVSLGLGLGMILMCVSWLHVDILRNEDADRSWNHSAISLSR